MQILVKNAIPFSSSLVIFLVRMHLPLKIVFFKSKQIVLIEMITDFVLSSDCFFFFYNNFLSTLYVVLFFFATKQMHLKYNSLFFVFVLVKQQYLNSYFHHVWLLFAKQPTAFINYSHFTIIFPHKVRIFLLIV